MYDKTEPYYGKLNSSNRVAIEKCLLDCKLVN